MVQTNLCMVGELSSNKDVMFIWSLKLSIVKFAQLFLC